MLEVYRDFAETVMAVPVIPGQKSDSERFAGAVRTYCIEAMMQDGKALQSGTSHMLGQNFSKPFNVKFLDADKTEHYAWQTSWGVSTRLVGALIMAHSDDKGLVLPPNLAPFQVVIVPIGAEKGDEVMAKAEEIMELLTSEGIRVKLDTRDSMRPGAKFFEWEKKGVPVRIEIGPKDLAANQVTVVRRDTAEKQALTEEGLVDAITDMLDQIQLNLLERARTFRDANTLPVEDYDAFKEKLEGHFLLAHWCGSAECEAKIKDETKATIRCIPFEGTSEEGKCIIDAKPSVGCVIFAKAY